jgi:hypothetical protein
VAPRQVLDAVQACVQSEARRGAGARERTTRSGHAGRPVRATLAWSSMGYGGSKVAASCGIGRGRAGELDGEVTGQEVVGDALPQSGVLGGQWRWPWRRRGIAAGLCGVGSG